MELKREGRTIRRYRVALGFSPERHKEREGDGRTPEGYYTVDARNPRSAFHLSLRVSYPDEDDKAHAASLGVSPGGDIYIHGQPNGWREFLVGHPAKDWTTAASLSATPRSARSGRWYRPARARGDPSMMPFEFICAGERLQALPAGALHWPAKRLLAVADLHLEKGSSYAVSAHKLLPRHDTRQALAMLAALVDVLAPQTVVCLAIPFTTGRRSNVCRIRSAGRSNG